MATGSGFLATRLDRGAVPLAVGDVLVIAGLLTWGTVRHNGVAVVSDRPAYVLATMAPFLLGWAVAAVPLGAYSPGAAESAKSAVPLGIRAWIVADLVGVGLRASPLFQGGFAVAFLAVTLVGGAVGVGAWRWLRFRF